MRHFSGKFVLRCPEELHRSLVERSRQEGTSLNNVCLQLLEQSMGVSSAKKTHEVYRGVVETVRRTWRKELVGLALFGSAARNEQLASSDADLLVVLEQTCPLNRDLYHVWDKQVAPAIGNQYSAHFVHMEENQSGSLWFEAALDGLVFYDSENRLHRHFSKLRHEIAEGRFVRKYSHGHPYWVRKTGT